MVDEHGSQCGFCTPGFVMSLYATYVSEDRPGPQRINDILAGNLCRCTGYGPIVKAARSMYDAPRASLPDATGLLADVAHDETVSLEGDGARG
ncbi:2Fe-2S iron-sulfur cluster-binding protein, partial [Vibrio parahaemolyticus]